MNRYNKYFEKQDDIKIGDTVLVGKWKNKKAVVIGFGTDKNNQPTIKIKPGGEVSMYKARIQKLMPAKKSKK